MKKDKARKVVKLFDPLPEPTFRKRTKGVLMPTTKGKPTQKAVDAFHKLRDNISIEDRMAVRDETNDIIRSISDKTRKKTLKFFDNLNQHILKKNMMGFKHHERVLEITEGHTEYLKRNRDSKKYKDAFTCMSKTILKKIAKLKQEVYSGIRTEYGDVVARIIFEDFASRIKEIWTFPPVRNRGLEKEMCKYQESLSQLEKEVKEIEIPSISPQDMTYNTEII